MKKIFFTVLLSALFAGVSADLPAQAFNGGIVVSETVTTRNAGAVQLEMTLHINSNAVTKTQSITITPILSDGSSSASFPYVLVNGKNKRRIFERQTRFRFAELEANPPCKVVNIDRKHRGGQLNYTAEIPREMWMDKASLRVEFVLTSCAGRRQLYTMSISSVPSITETPEKVIVEIVKRGPQTHSSEAFLDFETGSSTIIPSFGRNPQELARIHGELDLIKNTPGAQITGLCITGYASPDARYANNRTLAYDRARALAKHIRDRYDIPVECSTVNAVAEDWNCLRRMVEESDITDKARVLEIIDGPWAPDAKESKLRRLDGGRVWRIMLDDMFPRLRRLEYRMDYQIEE